ncbi:MAG: Malate/(S)-sulfolactate dehydrogenase [Candidatus Woesearchaeota archaeon]|nr:Malate/(S)-sulfolactate dehydrogenase [Candidatus Woesearchaeota archaeon]
MLKGKYALIQRDCSIKPEIINKTKVSALINGNNNPGMLVSYMAIQKAIELAKQNSVGLVGTNQSFQTSGALSYYLKKITDENLIGIVMSRSPSNIDPYGGYEPLFGTNPMSFGIPGNPPLILDMGMAATTFGDLLNAKSKKQKLSKNIALDSKGNPTTDPDKAINGCILSFDKSYKEAGLAMIVEILSGLWTGAGFCDLNKEDGWGNLFIVLSPGLLGNIEEFKQKMELFVKRVKNSKSKKPDKIRIPGEKTLSTYHNNLNKGIIEVDDQLIKELEELQ